MDDTLIALPTAILAKKKNFHEHTLAYFNANKEGIHSGPFNSTHEIEQDVNAVSAPTQSLLQRWLRETHFINVISYPIQLLHNEIEITQKCPEYTYYLFNKGIKIFITKDKVFSTYEEALEAGLIEALNLIS